MHSLNIIIRVLVYSEIFSGINI